MDGFKTFPPEPVVVTLSGTALELTPIRLGELPRLLAVVRPLAEEITSDPDWMALLGRHGDAVLDLLAITTSRLPSAVLSPSKRIHRSGKGWVNIAVLCAAP